MYGIEIHWTNIKGQTRRYPTGIEDCKTEKENAKLCAKRNIVHVFEIIFLVYIITVMIMYNMRINRLIYVNDLSE